MAPQKQKIKKLKLTDSEYKARLKYARNFFNFNFDARNKMTPARKAAISRAYNTVKKAESHNLKFVPMSRRQRSKADLTVPARYKTPNGVWLPAPKLTTTMVIDKNNAIVTRTKKWTFKTYGIHNPIEFAADPDKWISKLPNVKKAYSIRLNVGEHQYMGTQEYDRKTFQKYVSNDLTGTKGEAPEEFITGVTLVFKNK